MALTQHGELALRLAIRAAMVELRASIVADLRRLGDDPRAAGMDGPGAIYWAALRLEMSGACGPDAKLPTEAAKPVQGA